MTQTAISDRLVPICVGQYNMDADKVAKLAALKKIDSWSRGEFVVKQGWATMPGDNDADSGVARSCAEKNHGLIARRAFHRTHCAPQPFPSAVEPPE